MESANSEDNVTALLNSLVAGRTEAADRLWPLVYDELRGLADRYFREERPFQTLQATALVHEAYMRLAGRQASDWESRTHFFGVAAQAMRRILIEAARRRGAAKRGGGAAKLPLDANDQIVADKDEHLLALHEALNRLAENDAQLARLVELHSFGGMTFDECAALLGVSAITAKRMWKMAKGWLYREMSDES